MLRDSALKGMKEADKAKGAIIEESRRQEGENFKKRMNIKGLVVEIMPEKQ